LKAAELLHINPENPTTVGDDPMPRGRGRRRLPVAPRSIETGQYL
jgi:hypothetical protein